MWVERERERKRGSEELCSFVRSTAQQQNPNSILLPVLKPQLANRSIHSICFRSELRRSLR